MTSSRPARVLRRRGPRALLVYLGLVVVPVGIAIAVLANASDGSGRTTESAAAGHPLVKLLLAVAVVVGLCGAAGWLARKVGQPAVVGEIVAGLLLGPSFLGTVWPAGARAVLPDSVVPQLNVLAQVGVVLFLFLAGLELETGLIRGRGRTALVVSHVSIALPFLVGVLAATVAYRQLAPEGIGYTPFALFIGVSMSITALPVLVRVLMDLGLFRKEIGVVALSCALIDDVTAWCLLALVVALVTASSAAGALVTVGLTAVFVGVLILAVRPVLKRFADSADERTQRAAAPVALVGVLLCAMATEWIGVHAMFGAFFFGMVFPRGNALSAWLLTKVGGLTTVLMLPLFFAFNGLRTDLTTIAGDPVMWMWAGILLVIAVAGKLGGSAIAARAVGENWRRALQIGSLMNCRGLTELVVLNIGLELGVLSTQTFTMLVVMALVTTAMTGPLVRLLTPRSELDGPAVIGPGAVPDADPAGSPDDTEAVHIEAEERRAA
jgi:Kef-type K+ transport system membrane component KefB